MMVWGLGSLLTEILPLVVSCYDAYLSRLIFFSTPGKNQLATNTLPKTKIVNNGASATVIISMITKYFRRFDALLAIVALLY